MARATGRGARENDEAQKDFKAFRRRKGIKSVSTFFGLSLHKSRRSQHTSAFRRIRSRFSQVLVHFDFKVANYQLNTPAPRPVSHHASLMRSSCKTVTIFFVFAFLPTRIFFVGTVAASFGISIDKADSAIPSTDFYRAELSASILEQRSKNLTSTDATDWIIGDDSIASDSTLGMSSSQSSMLPFLNISGSEL